VPDLPIVCTLDPATRETRRLGLLTQLLRRAERVEERTDGFRVWFTPSGDVLALAARVIDAERRCCRFLRFSLTVEPDDGGMVLDLTGPPGTRGFLAALFEPPEPASGKPA
jgi:hypothetical protein